MDVVKSGTTDWSFTGRTISTLVHGSFIFVRFRQLKLSSSVYHSSGQDQN